MATPALKLAWSTARGSGRSIISVPGRLKLSPIRFSSALQAAGLKHLDTVKTEGSRRAMTQDPHLISVLPGWKQTTEFQGPDDWIFASPVKLGRLPVSYTGYQRILRNAAAAAGLGNVGTHSMSATYHSWLDAVGTAITVQQKLMRHSDIQTLTIYGHVVTDEMRQAGSKVVGLALDSRLIPKSTTH